ncbi:phosphocholine cytidylyltransferase family protein [Thermaerobacter subterraneus]|uniref:Sugar nucleotidyltransferase n=1 Tax=Thermaerobacter subterraneus DSM 13965 TaxID=867903 RepID=K6PZF6_9FIRM|nr:phosphocholine cytidylyltransferase family protein [Thermaerobacter subterraneus]EKP94178.1 putative sugar nucleotidyltransferase [Thermaerobacter subterraneus DSM 13965]
MATETGGIHPPMNALILAAGVGSRLGELTRERPKALLPLGAEGGAVGRGDGNPAPSGPAASCGDRTALELAEAAAGTATAAPGTGEAASATAAAAPGTAGDPPGTGAPPEPAAATAAVPPRPVTFLDHSLACLAAHPVERVYIVGGHAFGALEAHVQARWGEALRAGRIVLRRFPDYQTVNNAGTVYFAREAFEQPCLLLNSDIVYHPAILARAVAQVLAEPDQSFMVVDGTVHLAEEEMKVALDGAGFIRAVSKQLPPGESAGEYIGILYLTPADAARVLDLTAQVLAAGTTHLYYEDAIHRCLGAIRLRPLFIDGLPWTEVDTPEDYRRAQAVYASFAESGEGGAGAAGSAH